MKGAVLLFNIKIDFLVSLKCLSSDTGNNMKRNYQGSSLINQTKNAAGKKENRVNSLMLEENTLLRKTAYNDRLLNIFGSFTEEREICPGCGV